MKYVFIPIAVWLSIINNLHAMDLPIFVEIDEEVQITAKLNSFFDNYEQEKNLKKNGPHEYCKNTSSASEFDDYLLPLLKSPNQKLFESALRSLNQCFTIRNVNNLYNRAAAIRNREEIMKEIMTILRHHQDIKIVRLAFTFNNYVNALYASEAFKPWNDEISLILREEQDTELKLQRCTIAIFYLSNVFRHFKNTEVEPAVIVPILLNLLSYKDSELLQSVFHYLSVLAFEQEFAEQIISSNGMHYIAEFLKSDDNGILKNANRCFLNLFKSPQHPESVVFGHKTIFEGHSLLSFICILLNQDEDEAFVYPPLTRLTASYLSHVLDGLSDSDKDKLSKLDAFSGSMDFSLGESCNEIRPDFAEWKKDVDFGLVLSRQINWNNNHDVVIKRRIIPKIFKIIEDRSLKINFKIPLFESLVKIINIDPFGPLPQQIFAHDGQKIISKFEEDLKKNTTELSPEQNELLQSYYSSIVAWLDLLTTNKLPDVIKVIKNDLLLSSIAKIKKSPIRCSVSALTKTKTNPLSERLMLVDQLPLLTEIKFQILMALWLSYHCERVNQIKLHKSF